MRFTQTQIRKIKEGYFFISEFKKTLESMGKKQLIVGENVVREYKRFIDDFNKVVPILEYFNESNYLDPLEFPPGLSYRIDGLLIRVIKDLGILKTQLDVEETSPIIPKKDFSFINNKELRDIIERDYIWVNKCLAIEAWKPVIILAGGLIEALLLDSLLVDENKAKSSSKAPKKDLKDWNLRELLDVAVDIELINPGAEKVSDAVREYRNLVHPGKELRSGLKIESEEAKIAVEVLNMIIRDLQNKQ